MYRKVFPAGSGSRTGRGARVFVVLLTAVLQGAVTNAQTAAYARSSQEFTNNVSVHELQISSKAREMFKRGLKSLAKNDPQGSVKQFAAAIEANPNYYEAHYHKGVAEALLGHNKEAMQSFQAATDLSEGHYPRAEFGYALALAREGHAAEAERVVRHGLQSAPNIPDGHVVLGVVQLELHQVDEAEQSGLEALRLNEPGSAKGHLILADVCAARRDFAGQSRELKAYLDANPKDRHRDLLRSSLEVARKLAGRAQQQAGGVAR